ncbi:MAG TPA: BamA/TamA family outer membrane protein, partial [Vulgatibacter sp.]
HPPDGRVVGTPRLSPDGRLVAFSCSRDGPGRDIVVVPAEGGAALWVTDDDASDIDPAWMPDGSAIVFSSDRDGIFNLYAAPLPGPSDAGRAPAILRLTNVLTGAFQPDVSPDGTWLAWTTYGPEGFDVAATPVASLQPRPADPFVSDRVSAAAVATTVEPHSVPSPATTAEPLDSAVAAPATPEKHDGAVAAAATTEPHDSAAAAATPDPHDSSAAAATAEPFVNAAAVATTAEPHGGATDAPYPVRRYDPFETLAPQSWFPYLGADRDGAVLGASMAGSDAVGLHAWTLSAGAGLDSGQPEASATWNFSGWRLVPALSAATTYRASPGFRDVSERITVGNAALSLPFASTWNSQSMSLAYQATWFTPLGGEHALVLPRRGVAAEIQARWQWANAERPAESVSPEDGFGLGVFGRLGSRAFGGEFEYSAVSGSASAFLRLPWARHHVLAASASGGIGQGSRGERLLFALGGPELRNPLVDLLFTGQVLGGGLLRGYAPGSFVGSAFALGSLEYRFPLAWIDRSPSVLPLYAGKLAGAIFADAGDAFEPGVAPRFHPSAGAELRLGVSLGWLVSGSIVLGDAYGFDVGEGGGHRPYLGVSASF